MSSALDGGWRYLGPVSPSISASNEDMLYLDACIKATEKARVRCSDRRIDWTRTYELILQGAREQLYRKPGHEYVLDITRPEHPELRLVLRKCAISPYYTWDAVLENRARALLKETAATNTKRRRPFKKRKGWTNNFLFRK
jgi:hypothetical protein